MEPNDRSDEPEAQPEAWTIREGLVDADEVFITSSWRRNYDYAPCPGGLTEYVQTQERVIGQCLASSQVLVAHPAGRVEQILGWCCYRPGPVVHYVFVKPYYRRAGIGRALLERALAGSRIVFTTHRWDNVPHKRDGMRAVMDRAGMAGVQLVFNPALIFGGKTT